MKTSTTSPNPPGRDGAAANTHRALKQDEATVNVTTELLEDVLASDNLARAWKRVKANKGAPGIPARRSAGW